jgi:hypothetical protein
MLERDQAVAREAQGRREIARLLEQRREQASVAMGHEEKSLEELRTRLENQLKARDDSITKLGARCAEMQGMSAEMFLRNIIFQKNIISKSVFLFIFFF